MSSPPIIVARRPELGAARIEAVAAGYILVRELDGDHEPRHLVVRTGSIRSQGDVAAAVDVVARGGGLIVEPPEDPQLLAALVDDLRRLGTVELRGLGARDVLTREEHALLELLGAGRSVSAAAAEVHVSRRTAQRLLARARSKLGARSTVEAIARAADER